MVVDGYLTTLEYKVVKCSRGRKNFSHFQWTNSGIVNLVIDQYCPPLVDTLLCDCEKKKMYDKDYKLLARKIVAPCFREGSEMKTASPS